jgi:CheY-like chemotaxis protein
MLWLNKMQNICSFLSGEWHMKRVLIVDDQMSVKLLIKSILESLSLPLTVEFASDGLDAITRARRHSPDLVITDIFMPKMDGIELIEQLRMYVPNLKIIAISDSDIHHDKTPLYLECANLVGADYCLKKRELVSELAGYVRQCFTGTPCPPTTLVTKG